MCKKVLFIMVLLLAVSFADEVVTFDNNWASNPLFNVVSETSTGLQVVFSMHEMTIEEQLIDGVPMKSFGVPTVSIPDEGAPNLTGISRYIAIPQGAQAIVTILDSRTEVYHNVEVAPAPNIPVETDDAPLRYVKNMEIYGRNAYYPSSPVRLSKAMKMRGVDVVLLGVMPFQYNPVTKELIVYKDIRVKVDFIGGNGHFGEDRLRSRFWEPILQSHLLNYTSLPMVDFYAPERIQARDGYEYIIIVPDDALFEAWADTIKVWRKLQGISCEVYTLTEIGGSSASAIENFLDDAYNTWDPAPAAFLILSDYPSSGDLYGVTSPMYDGYASDNKYADVDGDSLPDMHHARMTAQTEVHLTRMVNKFLSYEREPYTAANFYDEPLVACGWQDDRWFQLCSETVRHFMINNFGKNPARQYNNTGNPVPGGPWSTRTGTAPVVQYWYNAGWLPSTTNPYDATWWDNGSAAGINAAINSGCFLVQHRDHGSLDGWSEPYYKLPHLDGLSNTMYPFVFSINCLTGKYQHPSEVFCEKFHRIEHGALGFNAPTEVSYSFVNDTYIWGLYDCMWPEFDPGYPAFDMTGYDNLRPCQAMSSAKYYLLASWMPDSVPGINMFYKVTTFHLFHIHTDAFFTLYSEIPQDLSVNHLPVLYAGLTSFTVTADDSSIIALTVNGEIIGVAEGTGGPVAITILPQIPGNTMKVTITKANYYRYETDVPITSSTYPYVILSTDIIDDATGGNNDGIVNPGETIDYGVWAKNIGTGTAQNVYGKLSESDTYVTLVTDSSWYSNIPENDSTLSDPNYSFSVVDTCPNGHQISFTLEFHDSNDTIWISNSNITVYAPILTYVDVSVVNDNNGNGYLDPGETADLIVTIENEGGAAAENITSTLTTTSSDITINDASGNFGTIDPGNTGNNSGDPYNVSASASIQYGSEVDMSVIVQAGACIDTLDFILGIGQLVPSDTGYYYVYYSGGPHIQSPVFDWLELAPPGPGSIISEITNEDADTVTLTLPFTFTYYGNDYTTIGVCSNGFMEFPSSTHRFGDNTGIPATGGPRAMVAPLWDDLDPSAAGDIYQYYNSAEHCWIIEFYQVDYYGGPGDYETFQVIFYDPAYTSTPTGDGEIVMQYLVPMQQTGNTIGIENFSEDVGIQYHYNGVYHELAESMTDSFALKYTTYPPSVGIEEEVGFEGRPMRTMLGVISPNPFRRTAVIRFSIGQDAESIELKIYDASGRLVKDFSRLTLDALRPTQIIWDGTDQNDRMVSAGVYFVSFKAGDYKKVEKAVLLR
ncbi:T9SS type A sorting domain-containing protein [candidate division WOR-3 bacterium]|nr:T9SS type A sorting domain-containing protein [candidate division WOR-3 bacterium]